MARLIGGGDLAGKGETGRTTGEGENGLRTGDGDIGCCGDRDGRGDGERYGIGDVGRK